MWPFNTALPQTPVITDDDRQLLNTRPFSPSRGIATRLTISIMLVSGCIAIFATALQLYIDYQKDIENLNTYITDVEQSALDSLSLELWNLDIPVLHSHLKGLQALPSLQYLTIESNLNVDLSVGEPLGEEGLVKRQPLYHATKTGKRQIGELVIGASLEPIRQRTWERLMVILPSHMLKAFIVSLCALFLFHRLVTRHLKSIANYLQNLNPNGALDPPQLERNNNTSRHWDELDIVVAAIGQMNIRLKETQHSLFEEKLALFQAKEQAQTTLTSIADGVITTDLEGKIQYLNHVAEDMLGYHIEEIKDQAFSKIFQVENEDMQKPMLLDECLKEGAITRLGERNILLKHRDGHTIRIEDSMAPIRNRDHEIIGAVLVFHDVTERDRLISIIAHEAAHDSLTGLINRREFEERVKSYLQNRTANSKPGALLYLDLDQFKVVNDVCGHAAGDQLLHQLGQLMQRSISESTTLARLGGDEFGVLIENVSLDQAVNYAEHLRDIVVQYRYHYQNRWFQVGVSVGLVGIEANDDRDLDFFLAQADHACYVAKEKGGNRIHIYSSSDKELKQRRREMWWSTLLREAIANDQFVLYMQPIQYLKEGTKSRHFEFLVRMRSEGSGVIKPNQFIPAAERFGLMPHLDRWVITKALEWLENLNDVPPLTSINLSAASLTDEVFMQFLIEQLSKKTSIAKYICFEITETAAIANFGTALRFMEKLRKIGCQFALDDFGTGMASISYLRRLPVNFLKIDGSFIRNILSDPINLEMVKLINQMSHLMGKYTVAEYTENPQIMEQIKIIGIDYAQGYAVGKPRPIAFASSYYSIT